MAAFHPDAELAVARAARSRSTHMMLSTGASSATEAVSEARGAPIWQQLYPTDDWSVTEQLVRRAEKAGCTAIVLTVDSPGPRNVETLKRATRVDSRDCSACHTPEKRRMWERAPLFDGIDVSKVSWIAPANVSPEYLKKLRSIVKGRLVIKGIVTGEDTEIALRAGADGIVVSNHGGRQLDAARSPVEVLPKICAAVGDRLTILADSGVNSGADIARMLAKGASMVMAGRAFTYGVGAFGRAGGSHTIEILREELRHFMGQLRCARPADLAAYLPHGAEGSAAAGTARVGLELETEVPRRREAV
jgi:isopentenyl diphosphate isomerase/L-lactate dehydrogenase-like FMN-dependent dehydrogenase